MNVLLIDTATDHLVAGVGALGEGIPTILSAADLQARRSSNTQLTLRLQDALVQAGLVPAAIDAVVCGVGPGSFTGVRIGVATAKGIAQGLHAPLYAIPTLDAIAWRFARDGFEGTLGVVGDAMRGEVYPALFEVAVTHVKRLTPHTVCTPGSLVEQWTPVVTSAIATGAPLTLAGNGLVKFERQIAGPLGDVDTVIVSDPRMWDPTSQGLLDAFAAAYYAEQVGADGWPIGATLRGGLGNGDPATVLPIYTRLSDAEENERKRAAQQRTAQEVGRITFASATEGDLDEIVKLEEESFVTTRWSRAMFEDELPRVDRAWVVARNGAGDLLAFAGSQVINGEAHILDIAVAPAARRSGLGTRILDELGERVRLLGATSWTLEANENNTEAIEFYAKLGFVSEGKRPGYYADGAAIIMGRLLTQGGVTRE